MKLKVWVRTDKVGSECRDEIEIDDEEWAAMTEEERESMARDTAFERMEWGWSADSGVDGQ